VFWGDHNPSANGAVTPYYGSGSPSDGSSRRAGLAGVRSSTHRSAWRRSALNPHIPRRICLSSLQNAALSTTSSPIIGPCAPAKILHIISAISPRAYTSQQLPSFACRKVKQRDKYQHCNPVGSQPGGYRVQPSVPQRASYDAPGTGTAQCGHKTADHRSGNEPRGNPLGIGERLFRERTAAGETCAQVGCQAVANWDRYSNDQRRGRKRIHVSHEDLVAEYDKYRTKEYRADHPWPKNEHGSKRCPGCRPDCVLGGEENGLGPEKVVESKREQPRLPVSSCQYHQRTIPRSCRIFKQFQLLNV